MTTDEAPSGEALMLAYGQLLDLVTVKERAELDRIMNHLLVVGDGTMTGALDVLPTLDYIVEPLTVLAGRYSVEIRELTADERADARGQLRSEARKAGGR